jgi:hypothetical protein
MVKDIHHSHRNVVTFSLCLDPIPSDWQRLLVRFSAHPVELCLVQCIQTSMKEIIIQKRYGVYICMFLPEAYNYRFFQNFGTFKLFQHLEQMLLLLQYIKLD